MSKKKQRQLLLLLGVLCAALVIFGAVSLYNHIQANAEAEEEAAIPTGLASEPVALTWSDGATSMELLQNPDGNWYWAEDADFPLDASQVQSILSALSGLTAGREIGIADELDAYGLGDEALTLKTVDAEGSSAALLLGNSFTDTDGTRYYAMVPDGDSILILDTSLPTLLVTDPYSLADLSPLESVTQAQVQSVLISGQAETLLTVKAETSTETGDDGVETEVTAYHWYCDGVDVTDSTLLAQLQDQFLSFSFSSLAYWRPDGDTLSELGFDSAAAVTVTYTDSEGNPLTQTLAVGGLNGDGNSYYCSPDGGTSVYLISAANLADVMTVAQAGFDAAAETQTE